MSRDADVKLSKLPPSVAEGLRRAFAETRCMDLYGDRAVDYIAVIEQRLRKQNERIAELEHAILHSYNVIERSRP